jgi:hypothetical protein
MKSAISKMEKQMKMLMYVTIAVALAVSPVAALAHEGHDHSAKKPSYSTGKPKKPPKGRTQLESYVGVD